MHEFTGALAASLARHARADQDFEGRLAESGTLAFRVAYSVLRHQQDAEDVAQEAFLRAHEAFPSLRDRDRFRAWLVRVTWRLALDRRRSDKRRQGREEHPASRPFVDGEAAAMERISADRLWNAIDRLPDHLRIPLVLASIEGHTISDVAAITGIADGTVKSRLFEARRRLKAWLA